MRKMLAVLPMSNYIVSLLPVPRSYSRFKLMTYFSAAREEEKKNRQKMLAVLPETNYTVVPALPVLRSYSRFNLMTIFLLSGTRRYKTRGKCWQFCQCLTIVSLLPIPRSYSRFILMTCFSAARDEEIQNTRKMLTVLPETS